MPAPEIPAHNLLLDCQQLHAELLDLETGRIWQSHASITRDAYEALALPPTLRRVGIGTGVMDAHYFRRSPGATADGPVAEREIDGHLFIHCADPPKGGAETPLGDFPKRLLVDKHHSLVFEAGREVDVIRLPDGCDLVQVVAATPEGAGLFQHGTPAARELDLPEGWVLRSEKLSERTTIHLPQPTQAWFFATGASFQGPVDTFASR